jgi:hypothetical protein
MTLPQIILPRPALDSKAKQEIEDAYKIWREDKDAAEPKFRWFNVHHVHDPLWRERFMSLTLAASMRHPFWFGVGVCFAVAAGALQGLAFLNMIVGVR